MEQELSPMSTAVRPDTHWLLRPFGVIWAFVTFVLCAVGRILCALLGLAIMAIGIALSMTVVGLIIGAPLVALGFLLLARAVF